MYSDEKRGYKVFGHLAYLLVIARSFLSVRLDLVAKQDNAGLFLRRDMIFKDHALLDRRLAISLNVRLAAE